jgi:ATP-binding cassette, subfamily B, bacterial PglK
MKLLEKMFSLLGTYQRKKQFIVMLVLILIGTAMEMLGVGIIIPVLALLLDTDISVSYPELIPLLDLMGNPSQKQLIFTGMSFLVGLYLIKFLYLIFLSYRQGSFIYGIQVDLSRSLLRSYLYKPYFFHLQRNSALLIRNATTEVAHYAGSVNAMLSLITQILLLIGVITLLIVVEPLATLILILFMSVFGVTFYYFTKNRILQWGKDVQYFDGKIIQYLQQGLGGIKDVKVLGREYYFLSLFDDTNLKKARINIKQYVFTLLPKLWLEILVVVSMFFLVFVLLLQGHLIKNIIPTLGLFGVAAYKLMPAVNQLITSIQRIRSKIPSIKLLYEEVDELSLNVLNSDISNPSSHIYELKNSIEVKQVEFSYPESESYSLNDVSLSIPKGSAVGIVGKSGAGKSTLIDIILGLLPPSEGGIEVDGINIDTNIRAWQDKIGYVPQAIFLTDDTLRNNIALGLKEPEIDDKSLSKAINDAQLQDYIDELPKGLETLVGERGVRISGGQRQRIGIARALYNNPEILILDEATSSLDIETEKRVIDVIAGLIGDRTLIIISHRLSAIKCCQNIYRLDAGKITQTGGYEQIISALDT